MPPDGLSTMDSLAVIQRRALSPNNVVSGFYRSASHCREKNLQPAPAVGRTDGQRRCVHGGRGGLAPRVAPADPRSGGMPRPPRPGKGPGRAVHQCLLPGHSGF